jgi:hypothetical protein
VLLPVWESRHEIGILRGIFFRRVPGEYISTIVLSYIYVLMLGDALMPNISLLDQSKKEFITESGM